TRRSSDLTFRIEDIINLACDQKMNECTRNPQATSQFISLLQDCKAAWLQQRVYANVLKKTRLRMRVKSLLPEPTKYLIQFSGPVKTFCRLMKIFFRIYFWKCWDGAFHLESRSIHGFADHAATVEPNLLAKTKLKAPIRV